MPSTADETDGELHTRMGTDAAVWAVEMLRSAQAAARRENEARAPHQPVTAVGDVFADASPGDFLHGWPCSAIETGKSAGYSQGRRDALWRVQHADLGGHAEARAVKALDSHGIFGVPADPAGSDHAADLAGSELPADSAGTPDQGQQSAERIAAAWRAAAEHGIDLGQLLAEIRYGQLVGKQQGEIEAAIRDVGAHVRRIADAFDSVLHKDGAIQTRSVN